VQCFGDCSCIDRISFLYKSTVANNRLWFSDNENNFMNEGDSSEDDYEDSDSNAEDYYQNDYPEDELGKCRLYVLTGVRRQEGRQLTRVFLLLSGQ
jgi:hypothetical protein